MKNYKKTHGQKLEKKDSLEAMFDTTDAKVVYASLPEDLGSLSLKELQVIAQRLGLCPVDSKQLLIQSINQNR